MVKTGQGKLTSLRRRKTEGLYQPQEHDESLQLTEERDRTVAVGGEIHESEEDSLNGEESSFGDFSDSDEEWPVRLKVLITKVAGFDEFQRPFRHFSFTNQNNQLYFTSRYERCFAQ